ncbi:MAG: maltose alpha-D-glucosyltransferase [Rhodospirillaceae bacterium]|nr:maltose alpha-D-glucosyltransferase [Rhodospirillaceae bacterium]
MPVTQDSLWYKDAVIYQVHVKAFFDSNNDGMGDFRGLLSKLDYLRDLGIQAIWLLPFYPSPLRDDGYDIANYTDINPSYGTMKDFRAFVRAAHERGLKVITELVINHTSDQHPWFQRARRAKRGSHFRNWYMWSDDDKKWADTRIIFTDTETSNWTWDPVAEQYFWHRFFSHQPDLNFDNPAVVNAVIKIMDFWLEAGVDGMRLDAIPYLVARDGTSNENLPETHAILKRLRAALDEKHPDAFFLAEANQWPEDTRPYFGDGDECHMAFHFPLMPRMYMAMAMEDRHPITDILRQTPDIPDNCQWAIFLRNHDELTLEMVTDRERDYLWNFYAAETRARINLGIRRRLAPLMENDRRKIELMNSLLFSMPGTPIVYYGDEIGMGDNIFLGDRDGVRTPMQWSPDRNGGFSRADPATVYLPPVMSTIYGFDAVNVEAQQRAPSSLLNWMKRIVAVRQQHLAFGRGTLTFLYPGNRKILAYLREYEDDIVLCVANLSRQPQAVELDLSRFKGRVPVEMIGRSPFPPIGDLTYLLTLPAYGFYWFVLAEDTAMPAWHDPLPEPMPDLITLVLAEGWASVSRGKGLKELTRDVLPPFVAIQRWFSAKDQKITSVKLLDAPVLRSDKASWLIALIEVSLGKAEPQRYSLPLAAHWDEAAATTVSPLLPYTLAKIRRGPKLGALTDASVDTGFTLAMLEAIREGREIETDDGRLRFTPGSSLAAVELTDSDEIRRLGVEQSNTSILLGDKMVLKTYRRLEPGIHPEVEIGRFLSETVDFENVAELYGTVEHIDADGTPTAIAILQEFVRNQGDGWRYTMDYLARELDDVVMGVGVEQAPEERYGVYLQRAATLGQRTAELHRALATETGNPAFDPEPLTGKDRKAMRKDVLAQANRALDALASVDAGDDVDLAASIAALRGRKDEIAALIDRLASVPVTAAKTRHHGDYHLGQVLVDQADFVIVDFEGEPLRSMEERRGKRTPLRDVAGMVRSLDYAAWAACRQSTEVRPEEAETVRTQALAWRDLATSRFLESYAATIGDCVSYPQDPEEQTVLLDLVILEKAFYEIAYEAANRPGWIGIPLAGVTAILDRHAEGGTAA